MDLSRPLTHRHKIRKQDGVGSSLKTHFLKIFYPPLKFGRQNLKFRRPTSISSHNIRNYQIDLHQIFKFDRGLGASSSVHSFSFKGHCHGNQICGQTCEIGRHNRSFVTLAFRNGLEYRNADERINSDYDPGTSCANVLSSSPVHQ